MFRRTKNSPVPARPLQSPVVGPKTRQNFSHYGVDFHPKPTSNYPRVQPIHYPSQRYASHGHNHQPHYGQQHPAYVHHGIAPPMVHPNQFHHPAVPPNYHPPITPPQGYYPQQYSPQQYLPQQYLPQQYSPQQYSPQQYSPQPQQPTPQQPTPQMQQSQAVYYTGNESSLKLTTAEGTTITAPPRKAMPINQSTTIDNAGNEVTKIEVLVEQAPVVEEYQIVQKPAFIQKINSRPLQ
eukprot:GHVH01008711.1.p1 GENE.GHVH01008711.1~~GHVH01008711.1.p1  ORF type:complete len:237 (+),score=19.54 GHVH01008711.1:119-829(+)